jgi:hypothetical protein
LSSNITELAPNAEEQVILLLEGASVLIAVNNLAFQGLFVGIGDFGERSKPEQNDKQKNEARNAQIRPLNILQASIGVNSVGKEDARG